MQIFSEPSDISAGFLLNPSFITKALLQLSSEDSAHGIYE